METSLHYDMSAKQLNFRLREAITARPGVELKGRGFFNTTTGTLNYWGTLTASAKLGKEVKDSGSTPFQLSGGVFVASSDTKAPPHPQLHVRAKKQISLLEGPRTVLSAKAWGNLDPQTRTVTARKAVLKLSHKWMGFTKRQDLKLTAGLDADWPTGARSTTVTPFAQVRENNWAVNYRQQKWFLTYDL